MLAITTTGKTNAVIAAASANTRPIAPAASGLPDARSAANAAATPDSTTPVAASALSSTSR